MLTSNEVVYGLAGQYIGQTEAVTALQRLVGELSAQLDAATAMQLDAAVGDALATTERRAFDVGLSLGRNPDRLLFGQRMGLGLVKTPPAESNCVGSAGVDDEISRIVRAFSRIGDIYDIYAERFQSSESGG